jgi:hypothetical protein
VYSISTAMRTGGDRSDNRRQEEKGKKHRVSKKAVSRNNYTLSQTTYGSQNK